MDPHLRAIIYRLLPFASIRFSGAKDAVPLGPTKNLTADEEALTFSFENGIQVLFSYSLAAWSAALDWGVYGERFPPDMTSEEMFQRFADIIGVRPATTSGS